MNEHEFDQPQKTVEFFQTLRYGSPTLTPPGAFTSGPSRGRHACDAINRRPAKNVILEGTGRAAANLLGTTKS